MITLVIFMKTYIPKNSGDSQCINCGMFDSTPIRYYTSYNGPYCLECWQQLCSSTISGNTFDSFIKNYLTRK